MENNKHKLLDFKGCNEFLKKSYVMVIVHRGKPIETVLIQKKSTKS